MPDTEFSKIAQQMVEATSSLVSGRTVNIMDTDGIIIASTEKERIGTLHSGAAIAIKTGRPVAIEKEQVSQYPGTKEGCNMPMYSGGKILGVVGIYGNPAEVSDTARLLGAYTVQYFEHNAHLQQQMVENELRNKLISLLLNLNAEESGNAVTLMKALHIKLSFPVRIIMISMRDELDTIGSLHIFNPILTQLRTQGYLIPERDIWGVHDNRITVIKSDMDGNDQQRLAHVKALLEESSKLPFRICAGYICNGLEQIQQSAAEAAALLEAGSGELQDMTDPACFVRYLMYRAERNNGVYVTALYNRLVQNLGKKEVNVALHTADSYYNAQGSVTRAAEALHIHKNTLQYRIRRVWDALGIADLNPFEREVLVRLCIGCHQRTQASAE
ncbi:MAG: sugar diacid recognition domain-containing protein [Eubacteriales bacterium]|nr:sugar diacid recognition domain-containing protein [Eubacteriales bacterium]